LGLLGAAVGAAIAMVGQFVTSRSDRKGRVAELLLEQCARVVALEDDFRNRLWEERHLGQAGRVDGWDLGAYRLASARLRLLTVDQDLLARLQELADAGKSIGRYWRTGERDSDELDRLWRRQRQAIDLFVAASGNIVRQRVGA
jgi:hypothetical protein